MIRTKIRRIPSSTARRTATALLALALLAGCSVFATRPVQEMSDTGAAIRAAHEVQADTLAPELYRKSNEWFNKARREYKFKNFKDAKDFAEKARLYAEQAELEAIRNNGVRSEATEGQPAQPAQPAPTPTYEYPTPTGTPAEDFERRQKEEEQRKKAPAPGSTSLPQGTIQVPTPGPTTNL